MSKRKGLGKLFNRRGREVEEYVTSDRCKECHPEKYEELVDEETSEMLQKFFEENQINLEKVEKENREKRMEGLLSKAFDTSKVTGVTYYPETEEYSFRLEEGGALLPKKLKEPKEDSREKEETINKEVEHPGLLRGVFDTYKVKGVIYHPEKEETINKEVVHPRLLRGVFDTSKVKGVTYHPETEEYSFRLKEGEAFLPKKLEEPEEEYREEESINKEVEHPDHYNRTPVETMEKFFLMTDGNEYMIKGALLFNILKYTDRAGHKGDIEVDNKKAKFYLDLLEHLFPHDFEHYRVYQSFKKSK